MPSNQESAHYNLRILWPIVRYLEDRHGKSSIAELASVAGLVPEDFDRKDRWISAAAFEAIVAQSRSVLEDDDEFRAACVHRMAESYGPIRYILWATSPATIYQQAVKTYPLVSTVGIPSIPSIVRGHLHMRVAKDARNLPFSRDTCIIRQAHTAALPTFWGLPPAHVTETACVANGDPSCELFFRWYEGRRWLPAFLGTVLGTGLAMASMRALLPVGSGPVAMLLSGFLLGYLYELRATDRINERTKHEIVTALHEVAADAAEARREILELSHRQREWTRLLEEDATTRSSAFAEAAEQSEVVQRARTSRLLGFSHDLKNPLQIIRMSTDYFREKTVLLGGESADVVHDLDQSVASMQKMLARLMQVVTARRALVQLAPKKMEVSPLVERLRRRLQALVYGRAIKVALTKSRNAPEVMTMDSMLFDRVVDNLLTNAAKYTEQGTIAVELDGVPGFLVVKVSDSGRGMSPEELAGTFRAGGSDPKTRASESWGVGLSVIVQLLDQIGGKLEVMSKLGVGTTFWVHLPVEVGTEPDRNEEDALGRVVTIRTLE